MTQASHLACAIQHAFEEPGAHIPAEAEFSAPSETIRKDIVAGVASLRVGKGVDGEDLFPKILSDLDVRDR